MSIHNEAARQNIRAQRWVAVVSVLLLVTKSIAFYITQSVAVLTDALESIINVVAGFFGLYSLYLSAKPRDVEHPYGHGKIEFISAAVEGVLITLASVYIVVEAVRALFNPPELQQLDIGIILLAATGVINGVLGHWCVRTARRNSSMALLASGNHLLSDTWTTAGIVVGLVLLYATGIHWLDSATAICFSVVIFITGFRIVRRSIAGIMDERDHALLQHMIGVLDRERRKNWVDIHNIRIIKYGSTLHVDAHLTVPWYLNVHEAHQEIKELENRVRTAFGDAIELFIHSDGCLPTSCPICIKDDCPVRHHPFQRRVKWTVANIERNKKHKVDT